MSKKKTVHKKTWLLNVDKLTTSDVDWFTKLKIDGHACFDKSRLVVTLITFNEYQEMLLTLKYGKLTLLDELIILDEHVTF